MVLKKQLLIIGCCIGLVFLLVLTYSQYKETIRETGRLQGSSLDELKEVISK